MPIVDIHIIENVFSPEKKKEMIEKITNTMVEIEGEALRGVTWVRILETKENNWAIAGKQLCAADIHAMQKG
jgi:4-oxalocrotonate tautomerase